MRLALVPFLLLAPVLAGCLAGGPDDGGDPAAEEPYLMEGEWSTPRQPASYALGAVEKVRVAVRDGVEIALGVFYPDIEACDWDLSELPEACRLPVVMDGGPYYVDRLDIDKRRPPWGDWLVPRGYIHIQMALRGTGESGGCMGFKAPQDVEDVYDVIDWIAKQPWSDGQVGMGGRSYDGTTAWAGAAGGHPALKTIIPISGAVDAPDLYFRNGTHEARAVTPHIPTYWTTYALGTGGDDPTYRGTDVVANVCPEVVMPHVEGPLSAFTGDASSDYWQSRDLTADILANYGGSAWVIHGLQDWNVDPSQAVPFIQDMQDAGIPTLAWLGQWGHNYPDNTNEHPENPRWDWADKVVAWFDHYLKGQGDEPWLGVEVEQDDYRWRREATYPPEDMKWMEFTPSPDPIALVPVGGMGAPTWLVTKTEEDLVVAGLARIHVDVIPSTPTGGALFAELRADGTRIAWAPMDLRYHEGGNTEAQVLVPGQTVTAKMQTEPFDVFIPTDSEITLTLHRNGVQDINPSLDPSPVTVDGMTVWLPTSDSRDYIDIPLPEGDPRLDG